MASPQGVAKLTSELYVKPVVCDGDYTTATAVEWLDMRDYDRLLVVVAGVNLTGTGPSALSIVASESTNGASAVTIAEWSGDAPSGENQWIVLECSAEQIAQEGADNSAPKLRYVAAKLTMANAADEAVVIHVFEPKRPHLDLTADYVT